MDENISLDIQVNNLIKLTNQTLEILRKTFSTPPHLVIQNLGELIRDLNRIQDHINQIEDKNNKLQALIKIDQVINSSLELKIVLQIVMDTIVALINAERGFLMLRNRKGKLKTYIARNWEQESIHPSEFALSRTIVSRVMAEGEPVLTTNAQKDPRFGDEESVIAYKLRSILCVPLKVKEKLTGVIYTDNRIHTGIFTQHELDLLSAFSNQAAVAIENARLFDSLRHTLSEVTQLKNLMDNIFSSIASGVLTADTDNKITLCNQAAENILGQRSSDLVGYSIDSALAYLGSDIIEKINKAKKSDRHIIGLESNPILPKRGPVTISLNLSPLKDADQSTEGVAIVLEDLTEKKRLEAQRRLFERMVSPAVIEQLDPYKLQLGGKRTEITILFVDIRGFTGFSEGINPEFLVTVLNKYLATAAEAVLIRGGTIDKFMGDGIMAWFNAPIPQSDHTLRAIRAALDIKQSINRLQETLSHEFRLSIGAGIHFGEAVLGLVGTEKRMEYTAIGDSVNTAKRIQENAAAGQILISSRAYEQVSEHINVRQLEPISVKGKRQPLTVYELIAER